jgi:hypothetical protein
MSLRGYHRATTVTVQTASFLVVRFGKRFCALPSQGVRGVLTREEAGNGQAVTAVGVTYHDLDLVGRLGTSLDLSHPDVRVVLYSTGQSHGAICVEEVMGMIDVAPEQCWPLPPHFKQDERAWITGMTLFQDHLALILNPEWVLGELGEAVIAGPDSVMHNALVPSAAPDGPC